MDNDATQRILPEHESSLSSKFFSEHNRANLFNVVFDAFVLCVVVQQVSVPPMYPHKAPTVKCLSSIFHPNIDPETGLVYLAILASAWRPVLTVYDILVAIQVCQSWKLTPC